MQKVVEKAGWLLQSLIGTTACESLNAAANIFLNSHLCLSPSQLIA